MINPPLENHRLRLTRSQVQLGGDAGKCDVIGPHGVHQPGLERLTADNLQELSEARGLANRSIVRTACEEIRIVRARRCRGTQGDFWPGTIGEVVQSACLRRISLPTDGNGIGSRDSSSKSHIRSSWRTDWKSLRCSASCGAGRGFETLAAAEIGTGNRCAGADVMRLVLCDRTGSQKPKPE